jgi:ssDNA thymidine ADP-ribosyltransferase, DarT
LESGRFDRERKVRLLECIHGLEAGVCDICFPKAKPEVIVATKPRVTRAPGAAPRAAKLAPLADVSQQRVYHLTHVRNLEAIVEYGALLADAEPTVDISSADAREARRTITVSDEGETVASYVPFFLSPTPDAWEALRAGAADPRISADGLAPSDFVMLITSVDALGEYVVADGDAAHPLTRFAAGADPGQRMLRRLKAEEALGRMDAAEILVRDSVPLDAITLITVANDRAKAAVKAVLDPAGIRTRIAIHPPWFIRPE